MHRGEWYYECDVCGEQSERVEDFFAPLPEGWWTYNTARLAHTEHMHFCSVVCHEAHLVRIVRQMRGEEE